MTTTPPLEGLGEPLELVERLVRGTDVEAKLEEARERPRGAPKGNRNAAREREETEETKPDDIRDCLDPVSHGKGGGTSRQYALRRLRRERPELHAAVLAGEKTAHGAMVEAGFRRRDTPLEQLRRAWRKASAEEREAFVVEEESLAWSEERTS